MNNKTPIHPIGAAFRFAALCIVLFGFVYSMLATGLGRVLFPHTATGSMIEIDGKIVGSSLVAQPFESDHYFHPRPSAANHNAMDVAGSNDARSNPEMRKRVEEARAAIAAREGIALEDVPSDLMTQSSSGIDPNITPESARIQIPRVARARGLDEAKVAELVAANTAGPQFGVLGQTRVNVLELNLALDALDSQK